MGCSISEELYQALLKEAEKSGGTLSGEMRAAFMTWVDQSAENASSDNAVAGGGGGGGGGS